MKRRTAEWLEKAEEDWRSAKALSVLKPPPRDAVCFHCQLAAEKYLKALLQALGLAVPRTHDGKDLVNLLLPHDTTLRSIRRGAKSLTKYAVEHSLPRRTSDDAGDESGSAECRTCSDGNTQAPRPAPMTGA